MLKRKRIISNNEDIRESFSARLAFYTAFIPLAGLFLYLMFALLGIIQMRKGLLGFHCLRNGLIASVIFSVLPIVGLILWAELPSEYYVGLNKVTKHGYYTKKNHYGGTATIIEYFRFGKSFKKIIYGHYNYFGATKYKESYINGVKQVKSSRWYFSGRPLAETNFLNGRPEGASYHWHENGNLRMVENFSNGKLNGKRSWYDIDGKLIKEKNYTDGLSQEQIEEAKKAGVSPIIEEDLGGGVKMRMIFIPPGEFLMGSPDIGYGNGGSESPQHKVTIKEGFYLCETEITQAQWVAIMGNNPSEFKNGKNGAPMNTDNFPVESISWNDAQECLNKLNAKTKGGYRLPSEAEWEYAARAGTTTSFCFGDNNAETGDYAWFWEFSESVTHPTGTRKPNGWGLFDLYGNVWELIEDDWHDTYTYGPNNEKAWVNSYRGEYRVLRGGSWSVYANNCRSAERCKILPDNFDSYCGVRFVKSK